MEGQSGVNLTSMTMTSHLCELKSSGVKNHDATTNPPPTGGGLEAGAQESPAQVMSNWRTTSCHLIREKEKQCLMTLPKEDQAMIHLETEKECIVSKDKTKVMITCDHTQCIAI